MAMILFPKLEKHPFLSENIYNWVESEMVDVNHEGKPRYVSKYSSNTRESCKTDKSSIPKSTGQSNLLLKSPQDIPKTLCNETQKDAGRSVNCLCRMKNCKGKTVLKTKDTLPANITESKRNFLQENVLRVKKGPLTNPPKRAIDSRKGNSFDLEESGLIPKYCLKEDYGKTPEYIKDIKQDLLQSNKEYERFKEAKLESSQPRILSLERKEEILKGLQKHLQALLKMYLTLPLRIETPSQIKRKLEIESRIDDIKMQIGLIERNKEILVGRED